MIDRLHNAIECGEFRLQLLVGSNCGVTSSAYLHLDCTLTSVSWKRGEEVVIEMEKKFTLDSTEKKRMCGLRERKDKIQNLVRRT